jgi:hypothetical protein
MQVSRSASNLGRIDPAHLHKINVYKMPPKSCDIDISQTNIGPGARERHDLGHGGKGRSN